MSAINKQDANNTQGSIALEDTPGVVSSDTIWNALEPNSYKDFGPTYKLVARQPINSSRQQQKGVITDLDVVAGLQSDLTYENTQTFIEGAMFAAFRTKNELPVASSVAADNDYVVSAGGDSYVAGDLVFAKKFDAAANNGLKLVSASTATTVVSSTGGIVDSTGESGVISRVGFQFASGDAVMTAPSGVATLSTTTKDLTTLGLIVGEWVYIGDDAAGDHFATAAANGFARVGSIAAHVITFDKTQNAATADAGTSKTIRMFFGRVVKNEEAALIVKKTYQLERTLGKDDTSASNSQVEYVANSALDQLMFTFNSADKVTWDLSTVSAGYETYASSVGPKVGTRPVLGESGAFNTTSHVKRMQLEIAGTSTPLYAFLMDASLTIKNNVKLNKAIAHLGGFDSTAGIFEVSLTADAYFANVGAQAAISENSSATFDAVLARDNHAIIIDVPLVTLGDGKLKVALNEPITLSLSMDAATAIALNTATDYTLLLCYLDYVPNMGM